MPPRERKPQVPPVCAVAARRLTDAEIRLARLHKITVGVMRARRDLAQARRLVQAGRCDEAQAALSAVEGRLVNAGGLAAWIARGR